MPPVDPAVVSAMSAQNRAAVQTAASPPPEGGLPQIGPLEGQVFLNPSVAPQVPAGAPRPLAPGEYVMNPNGSWSNEITTQTDKGQVPALNDGRPTVIPTVWVVDGKPTRVDEVTAANFAVRSGLSFPSFETEKEADAFSQKREGKWQSFTPSDSKSWQTVTPLYGTNPTAVAVKASENAKAIEAAKTGGAPR